MYIGLHTVLLRVRLRQKDRETCIPTRKLGFGARGAKPGRRGRARARSMHVVNASKMLLEDKMANILMTGIEPSQH
eukprot:1832814-Pleurochrysis_carterae.AAC.1